MKTKQNKIDRSGAKWLPGAMALAATTASSQAATVQITLSGNKISSIGGDQIKADLTGDGDDEFGFIFRSVNTQAAVFRGYPARGGAVIYGVAFFSPNSFGVAVGGPLDMGIGLRSPQEKLLSLRFSDAGINGGDVTEGWLQVRAFSVSETNHTVELTRLIFDDASTTRPEFTSIPDTQTEWSPTVIPEPSSFALLGLGAAGVLARRRRQAA
jgi:hypothetical protein